MQFHDFLPTRIAALSERLGEAIAQVHDDRFGLSRDEWRVLDAAARHDGGPTRAIQEATGLDKVAVSRAATALEDRGLIRRTEDRADRRIKIVHVTGRGADMVQEVERIVRAREAYLLEDLEDAERSAFERILGLLTERAERLGRPEPKGRCRPDCEGACEKAAEMFAFDPEAAPAPPRLAMAGE
ncbi:MAG: MarR family transcriptional regulator [Paracoccaceae bacterium]